MQDKILDSTLENLLSRINDLKTSIASMIMKIEHESDTLNWPTVLDNFALLSGQLVSLSKSISHDKAPALRSLTILPLLLCPDRDEQLQRLTEGRVTLFSHDLVPDYLRTKPEPDIEQKMMQLEHKATNLSYETIQKQTGLYSKVVSHVWELVSKAREEWETDGNTRAGSVITTSPGDTHCLVSAIALGKGLKVQPPGGVGPPMMGSPGRPPVAGAPMPPSQLQQQLGPMGKAPSSIKTNIKAGNQMHPYAR